MTPDQLSAYLESRGLADTDGVHRRAAFRRCAVCGAMTLRGLDSDVAGLPVVCDVTDLDTLAEAAVILLTGERTYTAYELPGGIQLNPRHAENLRAAEQPRPVLRRHSCGAEAPPSTANRWKAPAHNPSLHTNRPPF